MTCQRGKLRDGPFDIQGGGGWDFSSRQVIFFSRFFAQQVIFFKSELQQVFYFFEITHLNQKNVNESNTLSEKNLKFLFDQLVANRTCYAAVSPC